MGKSVAILAANGFDETMLTEIQRALIKVKATVKTIAPEQGVVNGWQNEGWGHYFPVDAQISEALGSDYDMLVIPGGERAVAKLKTNPHARRIINHFFEAEKPIAAAGAGVALLALSTHISGCTVAALDAVKDEIEAAGAIASDEPMAEDHGVLTADGSETAVWIQAALEFFAKAETLMQAA
jgi:protease I